MIESALDEWQGGSVARRGGIPWRAVAVAAAVLLGVVGSAAAAYVWVQRSQAPQAAPAETTPTKAVREDAHEQSPPEPAPVEEPPPPVEEPPPSDAKRADAPDAPSPERVRPSREEPSAEDWMRRANRLRNRQHWTQAERAYRRVYEAHPAGLSAYVARVAAASLRLEHLNDPAGARRIWTRARAMRPGGSLDVEILQGIAAASRKLDDPAREAEALRALVEQHAGTRAARRAQQRLARLAAEE